MKNKILILIRYVIIISIFYILLFQDNFSVLKLIILSIYVINNQLRYFTLQKDNHIFASIMIDVPFLLFFSSIESEFAFLFFSLSLMDSIYLLPESHNLRTNLVLNIIFLMFKIVNPANLVFNLIAILILNANLILYQIENKKTNGLEFEYYDLRKKEDQLIEDKKQAELYMENLERYTLLKERNRISREMHDNVGHTLSTLIIQFGAMEKIVEKNPEKAKEMILVAQEYTKTSLSSVRSYLHELKPDEFEKYEGIVLIEQLIKNYTKMTQIDTNLKISKNVWKLTNDRDVILYHIIKEILSNVTKHSNANKVDITFSFNLEELIVTIKDNGTGTKAIKEGMGLKGIKERLKSIDGIVSYASKEGEGFFTKIVIPKKISILGEKL